MRNLSYLIIVILALVSCDAHQEADRDTVYEGRFLYTQDSSSNLSPAALFVQNLAKVMRLPALSKGFHGLYIRIWIWGTDEPYVIDIRAGQSTEKCNIIQFTSSRQGNDDYIVISNKWEELRPASGWVDFLKTIRQYHIDEMRPSKTLKNSDYDLTGGGNIQFEIACENQYYFYEYLEPSYYRYVDPQANDIYTFLNLFNLEMNVQVYNPEKRLYKDPR